MSGKKWIIEKVSCLVPNICVEELTFSNPNVGLDILVQNLRNSTVKYYEKISRFDLLQAFFTGILPTFSAGLCVSTRPQGYNRDLQNRVSFVRTLIEMVQGLIPLPTGKLVAGSTFFRHLKCRSICRRLDTK